MMKNLLAYTFVAAVVTGVAGRAFADPAIGQHVPQFTAEAFDVSADPPKPVAFDSDKALRVTTYIFVGTTCPATAAYVDRFKQLEQAYGPKGVDFLYLYPNSNDTSDAKRTFHKTQKFAGRMVDDQGAKLARLFTAQRTSEIFLADKKGTIVYHGAVDDAREVADVKQRYLATALDELLAGKPITVATSQVNA